MKEIKIEPTKGPHIMINLTKCPKCKTIYHWGIEGWGNCPTCIREKIIERDRELLEKLNTGSKKVRSSNRRAKQ